MYQSDLDLLTKARLQETEHLYFAPFRSSTAPVPTRLERWVQRMSVRLTPTRRTE